MNSLNTMRHVHDKHEMNIYVDENPPVLLDLYDLEDCLRRAPDYSGVDMKLFTECTNLEEVECLFVDSSGLGRRDEPAMTFGALVEHTKRLIWNSRSTDFYVILSDAGQFQVYVSILRRKT